MKLNVHTLPDNKGLNYLGVEANWYINQGKIFCFKTRKTRVWTGAAGVIIHEKAESLCMYSELYQLLETL